MKRRANTIGAPSILGYLLTSAQSRWERNHRPSKNRPRGLSATFELFKIPGSLSAPIRRVLKKDGNPLKLNPSQVAFRHADSLYTTFSKAKRAEWKAALKRNGMTAYDLWMKEAMRAMSLGLRPPDHPTTSGGWSLKDVRGSTTLPYPDCPNGPWLKCVSLTPTVSGLCPIPNYAYKVEWFTQADHGDPSTFIDVINIAWQPSTTEPWRWQNSTLFNPLPAWFDYMNTCITEFVQPHVWGSFWHRITPGRWTETRFAATVGHPWTWFNPHRVPWTEPPLALYDLYGPTLWRRGHPLP